MYWTLWSYGGSRSDPQCALLPSSSRITACKPKDYRRQCRLDSPCLCGSAHSHVPAPAGLTQPSESIVSSPLHTSAPRLASCFSHLLFLIFSPFFGVWSFDQRRLLCCLLVITRCWWSSQKKPSVCYRCRLLYLRSRKGVKAPSVFITKAKSTVDSVPTLKLWHEKCCMSEGFIKEKRGCSLPHSST